LNVLIAEKHDALAEQLSFIEKAEVSAEVG